MKRFGILLLMLILLSFAQFIWAQEEKEIPIRPGMELKKFGGINMVVPEGTEVYERDGMTFIEGSDVYTARRFKEIEKRIESLETKVEDLTKSLEDLKGL